MSAVRHLNNLRDAALALVYPRGCELCGESVESYTDGAACARCWRETRIFTGAETLCSKCGRMLEHAGGFSEGVFCHLCDEEHFDTARAVGIYEGALRVAVLALKEKPFVSLRIRNLLARACQNYPFNQTAKIVPVPLHDKRLRQRGFNQAAVLARILSSQTGLPNLENCLARELYTPMHRAGMDEQARRESVERAFVVKQPRLIKGEKILLVDDVFTSGATASACAKALKENGAGEVFVMTIARA